MKLESELNLQSYLDGELSNRQARKTAAWIAGDQAAQQLLTELTMAKTAVCSGELEIKLPETREFYWSKIEREILRPQPIQPKQRLGFLTAWRRFLVPLAGAAMVTFLTIYTFKIYDGAEDPQRHLAVVENLSEHTGAYSFRSQSEKMFVVWVYNRSEEAIPEAEPADDMIEQ